MEDGEFEVLTYDTFIERRDQILSVVCASWEQIVVARLTVFSLIAKAS